MDEMTEEDIKTIAELQASLGRVFNNPINKLITHWQVNKEIESALRALIAVKEHKDTIGKDDWYLLNKKLAWQSARKALELPITPHSEGK